MRKNRENERLVVVSFRCPPVLVNKIDKHLSFLRKESPAGNWSRSSAAMDLVLRGMKVSGHE